MSTESGQLDPGLVTGRWTRGRAAGRTESLPERQGCWEWRAAQGRHSAVPRHLRKAGSTRGQRPCTEGEAPCGRWTGSRHWRDQPGLRERVRVARCRGGWGMVGLASDLAAASVKPGVGDLGKPGGGVVGQSGEAWRGRGHRQSLERGSATGEFHRQLPLSQPGAEERLPSQCPPKPPTT